jgi:hypothetical protein
MKIAGINLVMHCIFRRVAPAAKPIIRESVLEKSLAENSDEDEQEGSSEDFHGFSESEIDSAKSRASSLYSEDFLGRLKEKKLTIIYGSVYRY